MRFALTMLVLLAACGVGERRLPIEDWDQLPACVRRSALFAFDTLGAPGSSWWSPDPEIEAEAARDVKGASPAQFVEALQHRDRHVRYDDVPAREGDGLRGSPEMSKRLLMRGGGFRWPPKLELDPILVARSASRNDGQRDDRFEIIGVRFSRALER